MRVLCPYLEVFYMWAYIGGWVWFSLMGVFPDTVVSHLFYIPF